VAPARFKTGRQRQRTGRDRQRPDRPLAVLRGVLRAAARLEDFGTAGEDARMEVLDFGFSDLHDEGDLARVNSVPTGGTVAQFIDERLTIVQIPEQILRLLQRAHQRLVDQQAGLRADLSGVSELLDGDARPVCPVWKIHAG
jgi:hypothetical protein